MKSINQILLFRALILMISFYAANVDATSADGTCADVGISKFLNEFVNSIQKSNGKSCLNSSNIATEADESRLLQAVQAQVLSEIPERSKNLSQQSTAQTKQQAKQLRLFMALRNLDINFSDFSENSNKKINIEFELSVLMSHFSGFSAAEPLNDPEKQEVRQRLTTESKNIEREIVAVVRHGRETAEMYGLNQLSTTTSALGNVRDYSTLRINQAGEIGYQELISRNPLLLFVKNAEPNDEDIKQAQLQYKETLKKEEANLKSLKTSTPYDPNAMGLIFYGPAVNKVLSKNPQLCSALNSLTEKAAQRARIRNFSAIAIGVGTAGVCTAAAVFSSGLLGPGCFVLAIGDVGFNAVSSVEAYQEAKLLYGGLMFGGNLEEYKKAQTTKNTFILATGLSAIGLPGARALVTSKSLSKVIPKVNLKPAVRDPVLSNEQNFANVTPTVSYDEAKEYMIQISKDDDVYYSMESKYRKLGWANSYFHHPEDWPRVVTILKGNISAPAAKWGYHGTSTGILESLRSNGLNNMLGKEIHSGGAMSRVNGVTYSGDVGYARDFARTAAAKTSTKPMLLRFQLDQPVSNTAIGASRARAADELWYSVDDGVTWYPISIDAP